MVGFGMLAAGLGSMTLAASPTTQPKTGKVAVLAFAQTNPGRQSAWVGQAIRQGMLADLTAYAPGRFESLNQHAGDDKAAIDAARKAGAAYVVTGSVVAVGPAVRFDGRVLDVDTGEAIAPLKATGPADNLYAMETALADQLGRAIGLTMFLPPVAPAHRNNPLESNDYLAENPYEPTASDAGGATVGSDFGPYGYGPYFYRPYFGPAFVSPGAWRHHEHGFGQFGEVPLGGLGVPSIAGGGGNDVLDGGMPYGLFIPTNRAEYRAFNRHGGLGTLNIARPPRPAGSAHHPAGAGRR